MPIKVFYHVKARQDFYDLIRSTMPADRYELLVMEGDSQEERLAKLAEAEMVIVGGLRLSEAEIDKMVQDAEANAADDHKRRELADARNQGDSLVHSVKKSLTEYGDKIEADEKAKIEEALKAAEESLKSEDKDEIQAKSNELMQVSQKLGELMYAKMQAEQGAGAAGQPGDAGASEARRAKDDDVVDADFKEVKRDA